MSIVTGRELLSARTSPSINSTVKNFPASLTTEDSGKFTGFNSLSLSLEYTISPSAVSNVALALMLILHLPETLRDNTSIDIITLPSGAFTTSS